MDTDALGIREFEQNLGKKDLLPRGSSVEDDSRRLSIARS